MGNCSFEGEHRIRGSRSFQSFSVEGENEVSKVVLPCKWNVKVLVISQIVVGPFANPVRHKVS